MSRPDAPIGTVAAAAFRVPTNAPEADGTIPSRRALSGVG